MFLLAVLAPAENGGERRSQGATTLWAVCGEPPGGSRFVVQSLQAMQRRTCAHNACRAGRVK